MLLTVLKKIFLKLMNNITFGKIMENFKKAIGIILFNNAKDYIKYLSRPRIVSQKIFS